MRQISLIIVAAGVAAASAGCASLGRPEASEQLTIAETSEIDFKPAAFEQATGLTAYKWQGSDQKAEWIVCKAKGSAARATLLVMHRDRAGYEDKKFCDGWIAQTFLGQGFDVVTVNRPGYGGSTGSADFAGKQSMAALAAAVPDAVAKAKVAKPVSGVFGYSTGAAAAALYAKAHPGGLQFLILGGGIYDYEQTLKATSDSYVRADIERILKTGGNTAMEDRSVAYDVSGLPRVIAVYHGKQDTTAPVTQAKAFADALESHGGYDVKWQVVDGVNHEMPWTHHRKILEVLVHSVMGSAGGGGA